jgi:hypothetical protein
MGWLGKVLGAEARGATPVNVTEDSFGAATLLAAVRTTA